METIKLFREQEINPLRGYMSSSLTSFPNLPEEESKTKRAGVLKLNEQLKSMCKNLQVDLYLPQESSNPASSHDDGLTPDEVYLLDRWRVAEADFVIMNVSELSFGVGQEMEIANSMGIPTIILYEEDKKLSRMLKGAPCIFVPPGYTPDQSIITYPKDNITNLLEKLQNRIHVLRELIKPNIKAKTPKESFGKKLKDLREGKGLSHKDLSEKTGLSIKLLQLLEREITDLRNLGKEKNLNNKTFFDIDPNKFSNPGIWVLGILTTGLEVELGDLIPSLPDVYAQNGVRPYQEACSDLKVELNQFFELSPNLGFEIRSRVAQNRFRTKEEFIELINNEIDSNNE